jgi:hypothetical protein
MDDDQHQQESEATVDEPKRKRQKGDVVRVVHAEPTLLVDDAKLNPAPGCRREDRPCSNLCARTQARQRLSPEASFVGQSPILASGKGMVRSAVWRARRTA